MHFILSWDIRDTDGEWGSESEVWGEINAQLKECIDDYSWVRPLSTFYIVRVSGPQEWKRIKEDLIEVAECYTAKAKIHFVISPLMVGGQYDGWLPNDIWPKIHKRTA